MNRLLCLIISIVFISCNKYKPYIDQYNFRSENGKPDYSDLNYWAAHPNKHDPSDSIPKPLRNEIKDSSVDIFFLHPTTYTKHRKTIPKKLNAEIDDRLLNAKTDYTTILYQASVFNQNSRLFSPRYRQAHISLFFSKDNSKANTAFEIAYQDLKTAFQYYLQHWNNGRPIIIASHSQGSFLGERLLKEFFDSSTSSAQTLQKQLVAAYIVGWSIPKEYFSSLKMCTDSLQTGCICSWRTLRRGFIPVLLRGEKGNSFVTNPLSWKTTEEYASKELNKGSVLRNFNKVYKHTTDAQIHNGVLWVKKPKFPWGFLYFKRNYHIGDINLFYLNIRENVRQRISAYFKH